MTSMGMKAAEITTVTAPMTVTNAVPDHIEALLRLRRRSRACPGHPDRACSVCACFVPQHSGPPGQARRRQGDVIQSALAAIADQRPLSATQQYQNNPNDAEDHGRRRVENSRGHRIPYPWWGVLLDERL